ncbi:hypothetical protein PoB_000979800 [Plakobranchus ocellatus]|uniref:Uncharacterized protein n=1 Tax=Plakobranchus ocellatus TaxID=259542 RepID=A0AAV3YLQ8_9GAST|nr:hypothetical protein PoB_000979800 [Plakobranchus ocellatus]
MSGFQALRQAKAPVAEFEPATERSLQISGRTRCPLCHRRFRKRKVAAGRGDRGSAKETEIEELRRNTTVGNTTLQRLTNARLGLQELSVAESAAIKQEDADSFISDDTTEHIDINIGEEDEEEKHIETRGLGTFDNAVSVI